MGWERKGKERKRKERKLKGRMERKGKEKIGIERKGKRGKFTDIQIKTVYDTSKLLINVKKTLLI